MPAQLRGKLEAVLGGPQKRRYLPLGKLRQAVGYDKSRASEGLVKVGWLSASAVGIGTKQEKGFATPVTEKLRAAFNAAGIKMGAGVHQIMVPALQTYQPMKPVIEKGAPEKVQARIMQYLNGVAERSAASSRRVYRVYS